MRETYSLWELGQTPLSEKLHNETSVDRVTTYFQNRKRKECIFLLLKSSKIKSSSNFSLLQLSTALLLQQKNKIPGFYIACALEDPKAMESAWNKRINLFYRFWEVHSQGERGQPAEKKDQRSKSDEQVTSYHQKCQWKRIADFLLLKNSKLLDVKLFSIGSFYSCVQTPKAGISIRWNKLPFRTIGKRVSETRSTTQLTCSTACAKTIHYGNWDKHRWVKNYKTTHLQIELLLTFEIDNGKTLLFCC